MIEIVIGPGDDALVDAFHDDVYLPAFAHQREPVAAWKAALAGGAPYDCSIVLARDGERIAGGIVFERYPRSGCGLITYLVVAPGWRRTGVGARLLARARAALVAKGAPLVLGEVHDPRCADDPAAARRRIAFFERRGARLLDARYVQPDLGAGLGRDRALRLLAFFDGGDAAPPPPFVDGARLRGFLREFYEVVEGAGPPDDEQAAMHAAIGDMVAVCPAEAPGAPG